MKYLLPILVLFASIDLQAQETLLAVKDKEAEVELHSVKIDVEIIGSIAITNTELTFYNPNDRVLEGELNFPLTDNQQVFRFAMDVNGKLREGVVVEKTLGRRAFEGVVRQAIDPGLLEQTEGNNYRARVYPIPEKGFKKVAIGYQEDLSLSNKNIYQLLLEYGKVKEFSLVIKVLNQSNAPQIDKSDISNFDFKSWQNAYIAETRKKNYNAIGSLVIDLPVEAGVAQYRQSLAESSDYFYLVDKPTIEQNINREAQENLLILWDASFSARNKHIEKELALIEKYSDGNKKKVTVVRFSNQAIDTADFDNKKNLIEYLKQTVYDGGTNLSSIDFSQIASETILFTDGLDNLTGSGRYSAKHPIHCISSSSKANSKQLEYIINATGGTYINLLNTSVDQALAKLTQYEVRFIRAEYNSRRISDVYPNTSVSLPNETLAISGRIKGKKKAKITLIYGIGNRETFRRDVTIEASNHSSSIGRLWASNTVRYLIRDPEERKDEIINLAKKYGLVTPYTSLIILDRVEDYVEYGIEPPEELLEEYNELIAEREEENSLELSEIKDLVLEDYLDFENWWSKNQKDTAVFVKENKPENQSQQDVPPPPPPLDNNSTETVDRDTIQLGGWETVRINQVDTTVFSKLIRGTITDDIGEPLPGVNVIIKGTTSGTVTDMGGRYQIYVRPEDILVYSYVGFEAQEMEIGEEAELDIIMGGATELQEVVTLAYATELRGQAAGVQITQASGVTESQEQDGTVIVRGSNSVTLGNSPLFIVDGEIMTSEEYQGILADEIADINVIKSETATSLYGSRASDGVVVITTKWGLEDDVDLPDSLSAYFDKSIEVKSWIPNEPYIDSLDASINHLRYEKYLELRKKHETNPSFFLGVGNYFLNQGNSTIAIRVLSNIAELELENHELLKVLAAKFKNEKQYKISEYLYKRIYEIRPEEPHSKRDLALLYEEMGKYQKALDLMVEILTSDIKDDDELFPYFKSTLLRELNSLISRKGKDLALGEVPKELIKDMPVDIRIVIDWNSLETDIDLWVTEPNGEKCYFTNPLTVNGGRLTEDYTDGYGPEEYLIKEAVSGDYIIEVDYYDERVQKVSGPVTIQVSVFKNYGRSNQTVEKTELQLKEPDQSYRVGEVKWKE
ncbi:MAG: VIT domain-containing protein [Ekhidna sp.]